MIENENKKIKENTNLFDETDKNITHKKNESDIENNIIKLDRENNTNIITENDAEIPKENNIKLPEISKLDIKNNTNIIIENDTETPKGNNIIENNTEKNDINIITKFYPKISNLVNNAMMEIYSKKMYPQVLCLIIIFLINELIYITIFNLFFYNVFGGCTNLIFSFVNIFFISVWIASIYDCITNIKSLSALIWIYFLMYLFIMIKSVYYNPWYFPFYLLFTFINSALIIINYLNKKIYKKIN